MVIKSMTARDCMPGLLVTLRPDMEILEAARILVEKRISGMPVVDNIGNLVGVLSERDCLEVVLRAGYNGTAGGRVDEFMSRDVQTVELDTPVVEIAERFVAGHVRRFPVMNSGRVVGVVSRRDIIKKLEDIQTPESKPVGSSTF